MRRSEPQYPSPIRNQLPGGSATAGDRIEGWLFDIDELGPWVTLWVYDDDGRLRRLTDEFHPPVYAHGDRAKLKRLAADMSKCDLIAGLRWVQKREFWSGDEIEVLQLNMSDSSHLSKLREIAAKLDRDITFYNLDIPTPQHYLYLAKLFPLCRVKGRVDERGVVIEIAATNSAWEIDHPMPPLRVRRMRGERMRPLTAASRLIIATEDDETVLHPAVGAKAIDTFNEIIERRKVYKQMMKSADERTRAIYGARRAAMKWMLVTCFGYMGYLSSGGLAKLRQEMTFHLVYMQMTKPSHIGVAGELLRKVTLSRKSLLHTRDNACALDLPFFPTCAFRCLRYTLRLRF
jgi:hypothetical protein